MFSLRENSPRRFAWRVTCPPGEETVRYAHYGEVMTETKARSRGGRPRLPLADVRTPTIGVRVSPAEHAQLCERAAACGMRPAQFLREAALSRRLPAPPAPAVNRDRYVSLARLSANLNQLAKHANAGRQVTVDDALLVQMIGEVNQLRLALIGVTE
jgi:hypothetical protein